VPELLLGPVLRHVSETEATIWVETDVACEVTVVGTTTPTWCVCGHHYALVELADLVPDQELAYRVELDGREVWPEPGAGLPASTIRPLPTDRDVRLAFGSCRVSLPHEPPYVLDNSEHPEAQGIDALRTLALRILAGDDEPPDCLLMLGDQIYADDLSPAMRELARRRAEREGDGAPGDQLADFDEYALAYREAWSEPVIRWLLSTVPTAMIFDDHEIHAQWKLSAAWQRKLEANEWYDRHVTAGLMAYWIYQHLGNLDLAELEAHELFAAVRDSGTEDAGSLLREQMRCADRQASHSRWSFHRDLGDIRLLVIDSRAGRELAPGDRSLINDGEWEWIVEHAKGDFEHLLLASSVPFFLAHGLHAAETWSAALCEGAWGPAGRRLGELLRQKGVMDHWASFERSFARLCALVGDVATGRIGSSPPSSIVMLSGDVHHCYLAEVGLPVGSGAHSAVWQAVCSAYRKDLAPRERLAMRFGNSVAGTLLAGALARAAGVGRPPVGWRLVDEPTYDNQVGTLRLGPGRASVAVETTAGSDWRAPGLRTVFEHDLL
jgi:hypothetical protein